MGEDSIWREFTDANHIRSQKIGCLLDVTGIEHRIIRAVGNSFFDQSVHKRCQG
jgi:hypothetical protein